MCLLVGRGCLWCTNALARLTLLLLAVGSGLEYALKPVIPKCRGARSGWLLGHGGGGGAGMRLSGGHDGDNRWNRVGFEH